jgi:hypothetical protein
MTETQLREGLPSLPARMAHLPIDARGYPIPWFVETLPDGTRDFRIASAEKAYRAIRFGNCWVCGEPCGRTRTFLIGPMCAVNRTTSEPGCHYECAEFSAIACPFLTLPKAKRNTSGLPEDTRDTMGPSGSAIPRNPGVSCLWTAAKYSVYRIQDGMLHHLGDPERVDWFANKRRATREEILESIDSGMSILQKMATEESAEAEQALANYYQRMLRYLPEAA